MGSALRRACRGALRLALAGSAALGLAACRPAASPARSVRAPCPPRMVRVGEACIDRHEARIVDGRAEPAVDAPPAARVSFREAERACAEAGFRLCTGPEWSRACAGAGTRRRLPYGERWEPHRCNTAEWDDDLARIPVRESGAFPGCASPEGVLDLSGNVWEWTSQPDPSGDLRELRGGGAHNSEAQSVCQPDDRFFLAPDAHEGLLGFRCCARARTAT
jgi:formylglycine-generating enzyme required for sulfatase activity